MEKTNYQALFDMYCDLNRHEDMRINPHLYTKTGRLSKNKIALAKGRRYSKEMNYTHKRLSRIHNFCLNRGVKLTFKTQRNGTELKNAGLYVRTNKGRK